MSTRAVIARKTTTGFSGVYHHWDGSPRFLGATLFKSYRGFFKKDLGKMLGYLIDLHYAGWSSINQADFNLSAGIDDIYLYICKKCGKPNWMHYKTFYSEDVHFPYWKDAGKPKWTKKMEHGFECNVNAKAHGPYCFNGEPNLMNETNASSCGCEYAYVFSEDSTKMEIYSSYCSSGDKMVGYFGCGDPNAKWVKIAVVDLKKVEPDWEKLTEQARSLKAA